jgi:hypothetical protein
MSDYLKIAREVMRERQGMPSPESAEPLEAVLSGQALELWSDALGERLWLVADENDAALLGEPRGSMYTAAEARRVVQIADPSVVAEVHRWKREFNATVRECRYVQSGGRGGNG